MDSWTPDTPASDQGIDYASVAHWHRRHPHAQHAELRPVDHRLPRRWPEHGLMGE